MSHNCNYFAVFCCSDLGGQNCQCNKKNKYISAPSETCVQFTTLTYSEYAHAEGVFGYSVIDDNDETVYTLPPQTHTYGEVIRSCHLSLKSIQINTDNSDGWVGSFYIEKDSIQTSYCTNCEKSDSKSNLLLIDTSTGDVPNVCVNNCVIEFDQCRLNTTYCGNGFYMSSSDGLCHCNCHDGFENQDRNSELPCQDTDECLTYDCKNGNCQNGVGNFSCECNDGYYNEWNTPDTSCLPTYKSIVNLGSVAQSWNEARDICQAFDDGNYTLPVPDTKEYHDYISSLISDHYSQVPIGWSDKLQEGNWINIYTDEALNWSRWYEPTGEPNGGTGENFGMLIPKSNYWELRDYWNDGYTTGDESNTKINVICIKEEGTEWKFDLSDCWNFCNYKGGACSYCGQNGYCCSKDKLSLNGDCPTDAIGQMQSIEIPSNLIVPDSSGNFAHICTNH